MFYAFVNPLIIIDSVVLSLCLRNECDLAVSGVAVRVKCVMLGHSIGPDFSFRCLYSSLRYKRYPFTAGSTDRVFQPRDGIELATFSIVFQRCNSLNHRIVTCNSISLTYRSRLAIILKFKKGLSFKVENFKCK